MNQYHSTVFSFESHMIRVVVDLDGRPWFAAPDVRRALGHANPNRTVTGVAACDKESCNVAGLGSWKKMTIISEAETYWLVANSKTENSKRFLSWMLSEVTTSIYRDQNFVRAPENPDFDSISYWMLTRLRAKSNGTKYFQDLQQDYLEWCRANNTSAQSTADLTERMTSLGLTVARLATGHQVVSPIGLLTARPTSMSPQQLDLLDVETDIDQMKQLILDIKLNAPLKYKVRKSADLQRIVPTIRTEIGSELGENILRFPDTRLAKE